MVLTIFTVMAAIAVIALMTIGFVCLADGCLAKGKEQVYGFISATIFIAAGFGMWLIFMSLLMRHI